MIPSIYIPDHTIQEIRRSGLVLIPREHVPQDLRRYAVKFRLGDASRKVDRLTEFLPHAADVLGVKERLLCSKARGRVVAHPRQLLCYFAFWRLRMSTTGIGKVLSRDHTTVVYAIGEVRERLHDPSLRQKTLALLCELDQAYEDSLSKQDVAQRLTDLVLAG